MIVVTVSYSFILGKLPLPVLPRGGVISHIPVGVVTVHSVYGS